MDKQQVKLDMMRDAVVNARYHHGQKMRSVIICGIIVVSLASTGGSVLLLKGNPAIWLAASGLFAVVWLVLYSEARGMAGKANDAEAALLKEQEMILGIFQAEPEPAKAEPETK